jgi:hypothetical protein
VVWLKVALSLEDEREVREEEDDREEELGYSRDGPSPVRLRFIQLLM